MVIFSMRSGLFKKGSRRTTKEESADWMRRNMSSGGKTTPVTGSSQDGADEQNVELTELSLQDIGDRSSGIGSRHDGVGRAEAVQFDGQYKNVRANSFQDDEGRRRTSSSLGDDDARDVTPGNSGKIGACFNFVNSIVGAGIIGLPFAIKESGFAAGVFLLLFVGWLTYKSVKIIVSCGVKVNRRSYEGLCEFCFGKCGFIVVSFFMFIFAFGAMCAYLVIIGDTVPLFLSALGINSERNVVIGLFAVFIILPLCLLRDMAALSWSSSLSISADVVLVSIVLAQGPGTVETFYNKSEETEIDTSLTIVNWGSLFGGLGAISFAYVCQHSSFIVFNTLKKPTESEWRLVSVSALTSALVLSLLLGIGGYLNFRSETQANILNNFGCEDLSINIARFLLAVTMVFTFPMEQFVTRHSLFAFIKGYSPELEGPNRMSDVWHYSLTLLLWGSALVVALTTQDLCFILELTGAVGASALGYIIPAMCYFKIHSVKGSFRRVSNAWDPSHEDYKSSLCRRLDVSSEFYIPAFMFFFGVVALVIGMVQAFTIEECGKHECLG